MALSHRLFGIDRKVLQTELAVRQRRHAMALEEARGELARLREATLELGRYESLLAEEAALLESAEQRLLLHLSSGSAELEARRRALAEYHRHDQQQQSDHLRAMQHDLQRCRSLQATIKSTIGDLLAPFLSGTPREQAEVLYMTKDARHGERNKREAMPPAPHT